MNKEDFINEIVQVFDGFTEENTKARVKVYKKTLPNDIDYDKLYESFFKNVTTFRYAPTPVEILEYTKRNRPYNPYA